MKSHVFANSPRVHYFNVFLFSYSFKRMLIILVDRMYCFLIDKGARVLNFQNADNFVFNFRWDEIKTIQVLDVSSRE